MARHGNLRASDADREHVVERLRRAATEGRIAPEELDERVRAALTAITYSDLEATVADLPRPRSRSGSTRATRSGSHATVAGWAWSTARANPFLLVFMIPVVVAAGTMLLALSVTWLTLMAVAMILTGGGHHRHHVAHRRGPWALMGGGGGGPRRDWI